MGGALDDILPDYRHGERHARTVGAPPERVWEALLAVTGRELALSRMLMGIRAIPLWLSGRRVDLFDSGRPFLETFVKGGFRRLVCDPPGVLVVGMAAQPWRLRRVEIADVGDLAGFRSFDRPGFVVAAMSFELATVAGGTRLATETRVRPADEAAARAFRPYWLAIRAGSGLMRRDMLRAVSRRAEAAASLV